MTSAFQIKLARVAAAAAACLPRAIKTSWSSADVRNRLPLGRQYNKSLNLVTYIHFPTLYKKRQTIQITVDLKVAKTVFHRYSIETKRVNAKVFIRKSFYCIDLFTTLRAAVMGGLFYKKNGETVQKTK